MRLEDEPVGIEEEEDGSRERRCAFRIEEGLRLWIVGGELLEKELVKTGNSVVLDE